MGRARGGGGADRQVRQLKRQSGTGRERRVGGRVGGGGAKRVGKEERESIVQSKRHPGSRHV